MLILVGVSVKVALNGGLFDSAQNSKTKWELAQVEEPTALDNYIEEIEKYGSGGISMLEGDGQTYYTLAPTALSFRSSADINDFQEVQINGETIDPSNYTITEGSTIITLSIDYLKTLEEDDYNISIVSKTGAPSAKFSIIEPDVNSDGFYYNQPYTAYVEYFDDNCSFFIRKDGTLDATVSGIVETCSYTVDGKDMTVTSTSLGSLNCTISPDGTTIYCAELAGNFVLGDETFAADEDYIYTYDSSLGGYVVNVIDKTKSTYGAIKNGINGYRTVMLANGIFENNDKLTKCPEIPQNSIIYVGENAFYGCSNLTNVVLPDSVKAIGLNAFALCSNLTSITIPPYITEICNSTFKGCTSLTNIGIPDTVARIDERAFEGCTSLESVTLCVGVKNISTAAFSDCTSLTSITYMGNMENWSQVTLDNTWNSNSAITTIECFDGTVTL